MRWHLVCAIPVASFLLSAAGCGPEATVNLSYDRPAEIQIDSNVRTLGIAEFGGSTPQDRKWGEIASDRLAAELDNYNKQFNRYTLVDRKRLGAILGEQDLQAAFSETGQAVEAGKLAKVDAMIYGSVNVNARDERSSRTAFDPLRRTTRTVVETKRYVMAAVNFTIDNVQTGTTLATVSATREFDSDEDKDSGAKSLTKAMGFSSGNLPPQDQIISQLIEQYVQEFVQKISPHTVNVTEKLRGGKTEAVKTGNKLAKAGDYAEALEVYEGGIRNAPADHEAVFNAGVMLEAMNRLDEAESYYDRAFNMKPEEQYVLARKRVRTELGM